MACFEKYQNPQKTCDLWCRVLARIQVICVLHRVDCNGNHSICLHNNAAECSGTIIQSDKTFVVLDRRNLSSACDLVTETLAILFLLQHGWILPDLVMIVGSYLTLTPHVRVWEVVRTNHLTGDREEIQARKGGPDIAVRKERGALGDILHIQEIDEREEKEETWEESLCVVQVLSTRRASRGCYKRFSWKEMRKWRTAILPLLPPVERSSDGTLLRNGVDRFPSHMNPLPLSTVFATVPLPMFPSILVDSSNASFRYLRMWHCLAHSRNHMHTEEKRQHALDSVSSPDNPFFHSWKFSTPLSPGDFQIMIEMGQMMEAERNFQILRRAFRDDVSAIRQGEEFLL